MNFDKESNNEDISLSIPIKISFTALINHLNKKFVGKTISRDNANGREINYFKILDIAIDKSDFHKYNIELKLKLETLTTFYNKRELHVSVHARVYMDMKSQRISIAAYEIDSTGKSWIANQMLKSVVNTFIYRKIIKNLSIELLPLIDEKLIQLNEKLASKIELKSGISILGLMKSLTITHFEVKQNDIWVILNINGWGIIDIESLDF